MRAIRDVNRLWARVDLIHGGWYNCWDYLRRPEIRRRERDEMPRGNKLLRAIWRKANK